MTDPKKPEIRIVAEAVIGKPASKADEAREDIKATLVAPQLPAQLRTRIETSDMRDAEGNDMKETALRFYDDINIFLASIHNIPELSESAQAVKDKLKTLAGEPLYEQISTVLEEFDAMAQLLIEKGVDSQRGADYLQNTSDGPGTPRVDMEDAMKLLEEMRPTDKGIMKLGPDEYFSEHDSEVQQRMDDGDTQFMARYKMLQNLKAQIDAALKKGDISKETAHLVLKATSGQMNKGYNVVGQKGQLLSLRIDDEDLGDNEAEKQLYILNMYWHLLGVTEGARFIKRFYK